MTQKRILLAAYGGGHVNIIIPLYRALLNLGHDVVVLGLTMAQPKLKQARIPFLSITDFIDPSSESDANALLLGGGLVDEINSNPLIPHNETIAYHGISFQELIAKHGEIKARESYRKLGRQIFLPVEFAKRILQSVGPDILIATSSPRMEKALFLAARSLNIRSCCICDFYDETVVHDRLGKPDFADVICVPFQSEKKNLIQAGRKPDDIIVSGNPALDYLASNEIEALRYKGRRDKGWQRKRVILWVKSVMPSISKSEKIAEEILLGSVRENLEDILIFRPHPNDPRDYNELKSSGIYLSDPNIPLLNELATSDLVVTVNSTLGLEANLLGKQVIQFYLDDFPERVPFQTLGIGTECRTAIALKIALKPGTKTGLLPPCMNVGEATQKIIQALFE